MQDATHVQDKTVDTQTKTAEKGKSGAAIAPETEAAPPACQRFDISCHDDPLTEECEPFVVPGKQKPYWFVYEWEDRYWVHDPESNTWMYVDELHYVKWHSSDQLTFLWQGQEWPAIMLVAWQEC